MFAISIVTMNRKDMLARVLAGIEETCPEPHFVCVTDNASTDGTLDMLRQRGGDMAPTAWDAYGDYLRDGSLKLWCLPENLGTSGGRNAHMAELVGHDSVRLDDKVLPTAPGWLTALKAQSERHHAIMTIAYDPTVAAFNLMAPLIDYVAWPNEGGMGGPLMYVPAEVTEVLGGADEIEGCKYGWDDLLYVHRARLLGWNYGFTLRAPHEILARASGARKDEAMKHHPAYVELLRQYTEGERDVFVPIDTTRGWQVGKEMGP